MLIWNFLLENLRYLPRRVLAVLALACLGMLAFGMVLQHVVGLDPCPMCIVQRYALLLLGLSCAVAAGLKNYLARASFTLIGLLFAVAGAGVAARQSWLQWFPPEIQSCGRDLFGMIAAFPLQRALPMIFRGSGDCTKIDWTFLGGSIANWSFLFFCVSALLLVGVMWGQTRKV